MPRFLTLEPLERRPGSVFASIGILFAVAYVTAVTVFPRAHGQIANGDTIQYYAYLRSLAIDGDLDFTNDYRLLYIPVDRDATTNVWLSAKTPTGRPPNLMSIGPALLWAPSFLATLAILALIRPLGVVVPLDGIAAPFPISAGVAGIAYATLGAYLCYRSCRLIFPARPAFWGALVAWLATPALYYSLVSPAYSHAPSLFACALFCYFWLKTRGNTSISRFVWLGILGGLAALVRWQDGIVLVLPMVELARLVGKGTHTVVAAALRGAIALVAAVVMLVPQFLAWHAIYGQFFVVPQGTGFLHWTRPEMLSVLFSLNHGLFTWTPVTLLAAIGVLPLIRRDPLTGWATIAVTLLAVYVNGSASDWWAGEAFGARRFIGSTVFFSLGLAALMAAPIWQTRPSLMRWLAVALVVYNVLFLLQYQLFMRGFTELVPYPSTGRQVLFDRLVLPWQLLWRWLTG